MFETDEYGLIKLTENESIRKDKFEERFGKENEHNFEYEYLYNHDNSTERWKEIFSKWKEEGKLS